MSDPPFHSLSFHFKHHCLMPAGRLYQGIECRAPTVGSDQRSLPALASGQRVMIFGGSVAMMGDYVPRLKNGQGFLYLPFRGREPLQPVNTVLDAHFLSPRISSAATRASRPTSSIAFRRVSM